MNPRYPIYIPSKGRADSSITSRALDRMGVPHKVVVEEADADEYAYHIGRDKLLVLPFSNLGQGSIPARNWIWEHAKEHGHARHWCIDDNIDGFCRLNWNRKIRVSSGTIFRCAEDFTDRYENVALSGLQSRFFVPEREPNLTPFRLNTRIYSIILINTELPHRWRGRYNEDTDLSIRVLKDGWVTILFIAFLADKRGTLTMKGGNTDNVYNTGDHRRAFAESLREQHPELVDVVWRYDRWHHQVDYSPFKHNELRYKPGVVPTGGENEYGMILRKRKAETEADVEEVVAETTVELPQEEVIWVGTNGSEPAGPQLSLLEEVA